MSPGKDAEESDASGKGGFLEDLPTLALAIAIALLIRTFAFQSFSSHESP